MIRVLAYGSATERAAARETVASHVAGGGLVVYPTETVYGIGCGLQREALETLSAFKGDRPFLLLIRSRGDAAGLEWTADAERLATAFWPGPLTLALTAPTDRYPAQVVGPDRGVAVRVSPHPGVRDLLDAVGGPVTSTSANRPGDPPARNGVAAAAVAEAVTEHGARVLVLDGGRLPEAQPSTIVRCGDRTRLIREGTIESMELERVVTLE